MSSVDDMLEEFLGPQKCLICGAPLNLGNRTGYCVRHQQNKLRYRCDPKYRKKKLEGIAKYDKAHAEELREKARKRYQKKKAARPAPDQVQSDRV